MLSKNKSRKQEILDLTSLKFKMGFLKYKIKKEMRKQEAKCKESKEKPTKEMKTSLVRLNMIGKIRIK